MIQRPPQILILLISIPQTSMSSHEEMEIMAVVQLASLRTNRPVHECYQEYVKDLDGKLKKVWIDIHGIKQWWDDNVKRYKIAYRTLQSLE